jgi:hypothetical protein
MGTKSTCRSTERNLSYDLAISPYIKKKPDVVTLSSANQTSQVHSSSLRTLKHVEDARSELG